MYLKRRWEIEEGGEGAEELARGLRVSPIIGRMLLNRGITSMEAAQGFLKPSLLGLEEPGKLPGLLRAAERIAKAVRDGEKIVVYGDYDVDGITATSILWHAIVLLGGKVSTYIPHRIDEGYGLNSEAIGQICADGAKVIVTVDCGITAVEPARVAKERGVDLIITDHHDFHGDPPVLPECFAIVHPRLRDKTEDPHPNPLPEYKERGEEGEEVGAYPNPHLCGAGVALKLAWGIGQKAGGASKVSESFRGFLVEATALAALGTIADVVPLVGENRLLAHFGLSGLRQSKLSGIRALIESASLGGKNLDTYDVGFLLAPRLNACGRLGHAALAVEMMTTATEARAKEIATYLESQNRERQAVEKKILEQALGQIESNGWGKDDRALVLAAEGWHAGVIGIVASRIVERFCRPTVMVALNSGEKGGMGQGSGRSVSGFHLAKALETCGGHLLAYGGHEMAAGLKMETSKLEEFRAAFCEVARGMVSEEMLKPRLRIECAAELTEITEGLVNDMRRLGPFGHGNRRPVICVEGITVGTEPRRVGRTGEHLQIQVKGEKGAMKCIAFGAGAIVDRLKAGTAVRVAAEPEINEFNGRRSVELNVRDIEFL